MSYPTNQARLARSSRFFARPLSFDLECPRCGEVYQIRASHGRKSHQRDPNWDTITSRFTCTQAGCGKTYIIGLVAWPIKPAQQVASTPPADQVPSPRQVAQLRKEGGGWWLSEEDAITRKRPDETNLTTEAERPEQDEEE